MLLLIEAVDDVRGTEATGNNFKGVVGRAGEDRMDSGDLIGEKSRLLSDPDE